VIGCWRKPLLRKSPDRMPRQNLIKPGTDVTAAAAIDCLTTSVGDSLARLVGSRQRTKRIHGLAASLASHSARRCRAASRRPAYEANMAVVPTSGGSRATALSARPWCEPCWAREAGDREDRQKDRADRRFIGSRTTLRALRPPWLLGTTLTHVII
jgi:hypothetical protein